MTISVDQVWTRPVVTRKREHNLFSEDDFVEISCVSSREVYRNPNIKGLDALVRTDRAQEFTDISSPQEPHLRLELMISKFSWILEDCVTRGLACLRTWGLPVRSG